MDIIKLSDYNIFTGHIKNPLQYFIKDLNPSRIFVLVDPNTQNACLPVLKSYIEDTPIHIITIPTGEHHKNINTCQTIWQSLMDQKADRKALLLNLGGGVIGDMGGFCAGTYKRGIAFVQIPTTLLAQVDASIGGKLGIDFAGIKNSIGLFQNPKHVFIDPAFLKTLSDREIRSGFAEMIKHSLIASRDQWEKLSGYYNLSAVNWADIIVPSLLIKKRVVEEDPFEHGLRKCLNFGHTIGHAVESYFLHTERRLLHGEAIAIGMICEAYLATQIVGLPDSELKSIADFIVRIYGHVHIPKRIFPDLLQYMQNDKKNEGSQINFSLIPRIGASKVNQVANEEQIISSLQYYLMLPKG